MVGPEDKMPHPQAAILGLQHVLAIFIGTITPPLLLSRGIGLPAADVAYLVSMALFVSGITSFLQIRRVGPFGSGLLSAQGTSFAFFGPLQQAGQLGGMPLMLGLSLGLGWVGMIVGPLLPRLRHIFTPLVSGTVVMLIGLSLIPVSMQSIAEGYGPGAIPWHGLAVSFFVVVIVVGLGSLNRPWLRMSAIIWGLLAGYLVSFLLGYLRPPTTGSWLVLPQPFKYGMSFRWEFALPFLFLYIVSAVETMGDLTATSQLSGLPITGPGYWARIRGGVLADSLNSIAAAILNAFPNTTYAQNNGVIQLTGVASRQVGYYMCGFLVLFGLVPMVGNWIAIMPGPVLGGVTLLLFGYVCGGGVRIIYHSEMTQREWMILAVSLGAGVGVGSAPTVLDPLPETLRLIFHSSVVMGGFTAFVLNACLPRHSKR